MFLINSEYFGICPSDFDIIPNNIIASAVAMHHFFFDLTDYEKLTFKTLYLLLVVSQYPRI